MEQWKKINDFEYEVSSYGRVKSLEREAWNGHKWHIKKERILKNRGGNGSNNYQYITLCNDGIYKKEYIHRLVAMHFLDKTANEVNHKDGNKLNNNVDNLEWVTRSQNIKHAYDLGLKVVRDMKGKNNPNYKHGKRITNKI